MLPSWSKIDCSPTPQPWSSPHPSASSAEHAWVPLLDGSARFSVDNHPKAQSNASQAHRSCGQFEDSSHDIYIWGPDIQPLNTYTQIVRYLIHLDLHSGKSWIIILLSQSWLTETFNSKLLRKGEKISKLVSAMPCIQSTKYWCIIYM